MTLKFVSGRSSVKFHHKDGALTVAWDLDASLEGEELLEQLRGIVSFMDAQAGREALPERTPGVALEMAQMTHPAPGDEGPYFQNFPTKQQPTNGWAAMPPIPARLEGEVEMIPPEEQE